MKYYNKNTGKKVRSMIDIAEKPSLCNLNMKKMCNIDKVIAKGLKKKK